MNRALPVPTWSWRASVRLEVRALGWMFGATLPAATVVGVLVGSAVPDFGTDDTWGSTAVGAVGSAVYMDFWSLVPAVVAAAIALPFTMVLGMLMRPVRRRGLHVLGTAVLAAALAAVPAAVWPPTWPLFAVVAPAAGSAGALARIGGFRRADRAASASASASRSGPAAAAAPDARLSS
ncbi:hypothetical protein [Curtobacterium sp. MCBA15_001]|uniref:hypothetical protein n=1 Tax=Curtobacterium sp. MCBA15_001 TaxID=1898731 RepID=UPI0008DCA9A9|nr:hypothetical protein [Curtobacterium sp. MCBA15_001]OIH97757.1 hypothetical protein BIU90_14520 [Curtobacterium sp. MCBA15_001]